MRQLTLIAAVWVLVASGCTPAENVPAPDAASDAVADARTVGADARPALDAQVDMRRPDMRPADMRRPDVRLPDMHPSDMRRPDVQPADDRDGGPPDAARRGPDHPLPPLEPPPAGQMAPVWQVSVIERFPHDAQAFTQGLLMVDGTLYESTGLNGQSSVRIVDLASGAVQRRHDLSDRYFAEGLVAVDDRLIQLTWRAQVAFVYDRATLEPRGQYAYVGEGWGLTDDGRRLILSDGTDRLRFFDRQTFAELGAVQVTDGGRPISRLNELEYIDGEVLANVWLTDLIARIDPESGRVIGWLDLSGLRPEEADRQGDVLNGIAWDAPNRRLIVTGKRWPLMFAIRALPAP